ncbi:hypothetical protein CBR_g16988 [Chara braunii]|uniref:Uncharacterized protein n=1 Tax=Chara braunii TaxID=69332 RepID=A0A388KUA3_CHABU|nr:hypothetical protein CBR_g16988 [Chara braunii]|eukprot:GBG73645.1 hypothetical protein CBR_g16988 [Chara braunii]
MRLVGCCYVYSSSLGFYIGSAWTRAMGVLMMWKHLVLPDGQDESGCIVDVDDCAVRYSGPPNMPVPQEVCVLLTHWTRCLPGFVFVLHLVREVGLCVIWKRRGLATCCLTHRVALLEL